MISTLSTAASAMHWRNHIRVHLIEPRSRAEELTGILTSSQYVHLLEVNVIQDRFYREQINGVIYFRPKFAPLAPPISEYFEKFEVSLCLPILYELMTFPILDLLDEFAFQGGFLVAVEHLWDHSSCETFPVHGVLLGRMQRIRVSGILQCWCSKLCIDKVSISSFLMNERSRLGFLRILSVIKIF